MKKVLAISSVLLGVVFLAGCGQQPVSQTQPTTPTSVAQKPAQPVATQPAPTTPSNTTPTETPEQIISRLVAKDNNMIIAVESSDSDHIYALINYKSGSGHLVLAAKVNGEWKKAYEGQDCSKKEMAKYNFPPAMLSSCY
jgi:PBP1b-binding outer membrane lipoprotein LpoB